VFKTTFAPSRLRVLNNFQLSIFNSLHAAFHAEGSRYGGENSRQRLKNEFPSFLFHNVQLTINMPTADICFRFLTDNNFSQSSTSYASSQSTQSFQSFYFYQELSASCRHAP
jgi:hypothetical protein